VNAQRAPQPQSARGTTTAKPVGFSRAAKAKSEPAASAREIEARRNASCASAMAHTSAASMGTSGMHFRA
jgi:hypothetical protein